jgi:hypothetical protein
MTRLASIAEKATGRSYWYEYKDSWRTRYYSFDDGETWHKSKSRAFQAAKQTNKLKERKQ